MSWGGYGWRPYVPVAQRLANAARQVEKLVKKAGRAACPIVLEGRKIANTFWGKSWCDNLEAYSDFANRLPRGRTYVRNGSVVDLQVSSGKIEALVAGSELYKVHIKIKPLPPRLWSSIQTDCAGKIDSLIELLQGKLSSGVMQIVTRRDRGLFPSPKEIQLDCSCPDWADVCKHVAAVLYGVGARLDSQPELLFLLRGVDPAALISKASAAEAIKPASGSGAPAMNESEMAEVFGIELAAGPSSASVTDTTESPTPPATSKRKRTRSRSRKQVVKLSPQARARLAAAAKARWKQLKAGA